MESKFESSFIPRSSAIGSDTNKKTSLFGILAIIIFTLSLLAIAGVFAYKKITENSIKNLESSLATAQASVDKGSINNLVNFDKKLKAINEILKNHVAVSGYLTMLEANTVSNVQFSSLKYSALTGASPLAVTMDGKAKSYAAVAQEEAIILKDPNISKISFDNLSLDNSSGGVLFTMKAEFKTNLVKWSNLLSTTTSTTTP